MRDDPQARARRVEVGELLRELRGKRGLTQAQLARAARIGQASLSNYEKGRRDIPSTALLGVAGALGLSLGGVLDVDHILIVRDERMREAVRILVRSPDVLDSIAGPRPPPPPRPPRQRKVTADDEEGDGESAEAEDGSAGGEDESSDAEGNRDDESAEAEDESSGTEDDGEGVDAEDVSTDAGGDSSDADDQGDVAQLDTGAQA